MVTVEAALALVGIILVLVMCLAAIGTVRKQASLCQVVREAARAAAIGEEMAATSQDMQLATLTVDKWIHVQGESAAIGLGGFNFGTVKCHAAVLNEGGL